MILRRTESDLLGLIDVPDDALYGAQTQRAIGNFPIGSGKTIGRYANLIRGLIYIKKAAAQVNRRNVFLSGDKAESIIKAADLVLKQGNYTTDFPVHSLHGGGGTSANMNANEVLANLAEEILGGKRGQYKLVHPNDHVNLHQSTNDVYPTACHMAVILSWPVLQEALSGLQSAFERRATELSGQNRIARTCLQDAVEVTFGDLLGGYAAFMARSNARIDAAVDRLHMVNLGGTIVGRAIDVPDAYRREIVPMLCEIVGNQKFCQADNLYDAAQNPDELAVVSAQLDILARGLIKVAQDFRLMGSGPETGFGEIRLPAVQPGSSIMPGKINPVIPEFLMQACFQVIGANTACQAALDHGELDLNIWESVMVTNVLDAMELLAIAVATFGEKCVRGFTVNTGCNNQNTQTIIPRLTELMRLHGYSKISELCKKAANDPARLRTLLQESIFEEKDRHK